MDVHLYEFARVVSNAMNSERKGYFKILARKWRLGKRVQFRVSKMVSEKMEPLSYAAYALSEEVRLEYSGYVFDPEKASCKSILFLSLYFKCL